MRIAHAISITVLALAAHASAQGVYLDDAFDGTFLYTTDVTYASGTTWPCPSGVTAYSNLNGHYLSGSASYPSYVTLDDSLFGVDGVNYTWSTWFSTYFYYRGSCTVFTSTPLLRSTP